MSRFFVGHLSTIVGVALTVGLLASSPLCARSEPADSSEAGKLCTRLWTDYVEALKGVDPVKITAWFTKDAVLLYPDKPEVRGRDTIQAHLVNEFQGLKFVELTFALDHFAVVGNQALTFATLQEHYQQGSGPQAKSQARCGVVWQRQPDGTWQIRYFLVNYLEQ